MNAINLQDDEGRYLPYRWEICAGCRGNGKRMTQSIAEHAYTREDFEEDPDFAEAYFDGTYDVQCWECDGTGKVRVADVPRMSFAQKRVLAQRRREAEERARWAREDAQILRMESGGYGY